MPCKVSQRRPPLTEIRGVFCFMIDEDYLYNLQTEYAKKNGIHGESEIECFESFGSGYTRAISDVRNEISRRISIIKDQLIGQTPEDLERHYKLIGKKDALESLLKYMQEL